MTWWVQFLVASLLQVVHQPSPSEVWQRVEALRSTVRVLYVAAHPDDENTTLLSWLVGERNARAGYLSLTRGDGGQNLIGTEQSPLLGIIRTWELLSARNVDGATQFIASMRDFGYSKTSEETLEIWDRDRALRDTVWIIRSFRPHVVITRFPETGETHGHHLASAILAHEAWDAANDPDMYPEQLLHAETWQPVRLLHNVPSWNLDPAAVSPDWIPVDIGGYGAARGASWGEVSAASRSMHQSQGFGAASRRGPQMEYFTLLEGEPVVGNDILSGVDGTWAMVPGGEDVDEALQRAASAIRPDSAADAIPALVDAWQALNDVTDTQLRDQTQAAIVELIVAADGLVLDARSTASVVAPGQQVDVTYSALSRAGGTGTLEEIVQPAGTIPLPNGQVSLTTHTPFTLTAPLLVGADAQPSTHYWLNNGDHAGHDGVENLADLGLPIGPPSFVAEFRVRYDDQPLIVRRPVRSVWVDPVLGERTRQLQLMPPVTATPTAQSYVVRQGESTRVDLQLRSTGENPETVVRLSLPDGFSARPETHSVSLAAGEQRTISFDIVADDGASPAQVTAVVETGGRDWSSQATEINYPHIPVQWVLRNGSFRVAPLAITVPEIQIGYIAGPGDLVAEGLMSVGADVRVIPAEQFRADDLAGIQTLLVGIRAFNATPALHQSMPAILDWVADGGTLIVQYQTNSRVGPLAGAISAAPIVIGRGRVTDETASIEFLESSHAVFQQPHAIVEADLQGWVQERGLYFAETWDTAWTPLMRMADPDEAPQDGALLVSEHGEGIIVYTGISFFRQIPAGVPGAYRLLLNLVSLGHL